MVGLLPAEAAETCRPADGPAESKIVINRHLSISLRSFRLTARIVYTERSGCHSTKVMQERTMNS